MSISPILTGAKAAELVVDDPKYTYVDDPLPDAACEAAIEQTGETEQETLLREGIQALIQEANEAVTKNPPARLRFARGGRLASKRSVRKGKARRALEVQRYVGKVLKEAVTGRARQLGKVVVMDEMDAVPLYPGGPTRGKLRKAKEYLDLYGRGDQGKMNHYAGRKV